MPAKSAELSLLDTNVFIDATDERRPRHSAALFLLEGGRSLVLCAQVIREYLVVATRPVALNGLGLELPDALSNLAEFRTVVRMLPEEKPVLNALLGLLRGAPPCQGNTIHDAFLVATMTVHRVRRLITSNPRHFHRFDDLIEVVPLA